MINVLIIEDNLQYVKNILNTILNKFDDINLKYIATNPKEAEEIILNSCFDLIFLDLNLSGEKGIEILKKIKSINKINFFNIILIAENTKFTIKCQKNLVSIIL